MITPSVGGPAERGGIAPRDTLVAIDGRPLAGLTLYDAGEMLQGPEGSEVGPHSLVLNACARAWLCVGCGRDAAGA